MATGTPADEIEQKLNKLRNFAFVKRMDQTNDSDGQENSDGSSKVSDSDNISEEKVKQQSSGGNESASEDERVKHVKCRKARRVYAIKDSDSEDDSNDSKTNPVPDDSSSDSDLKSKIRSSFLKTCGDAPSSTSENLTQRIKNAYSKLSTKRIRPVIKSSSEDEDEVVKETRSENGTGTENGSQPVDEILLKESCIVKLYKQFPHCDTMDIQDALVKSNWSTEDAASIISKLYEKATENGNCSGHDRKKNMSNGDGKRKRGKHERSHRKKKKKRRDSADSGDDGDGSFSFHKDDEEIYDSDDSEIDDTLTPARQMVLKYFETATFEEMALMPHCSKRKAEAIIQLRPFAGWVDLITKFQNEKSVNTDLIKSAKDVLNSRKVITKLMKKCEVLASELGEKVSCLMNVDGKSTDRHTRLKEQPSLLNSENQLTPYQLLGLNWLILIHEHHVNGILADEMGLGKTIQAIAFLSYCVQIGITGPFLVVAPSSTLDNWAREIGTWCATLNVTLYHGSQEYRRFLRGQLFNTEKGIPDILLSSYNLVAGAGEDRIVFKKIPFEYVVFDEAHLLKNMETIRYQHLMRVNAKRRILLTGTPLQNNLLELMSLLQFLMPKMFDGKSEHLKTVFSMASKKGLTESQNAYERERVNQAKRIMKPFILRRLKTEVMQELPNKKDEVVVCPLSSKQKELYEDLIVTFSKEMKKDNGGCHGKSGIGMMMQLRKLANHPLLLRYQYSHHTLVKMAKLIILEPSRPNAEEKYVIEDMEVMSDFELHKLCLMHKSLTPYCLSRKALLDSGKFEMLDKLLPDMQSRGDRILLFSQFVIVLDIIEEYMRLNNYKFIRLDGSTPVEERQNLIDTYTHDPSIFVFLLSTRAGGLGINLIAANVVILHDIDFNPYNDKQAVDRCHRLGQTRVVKIIRLIGKDTIEEAILRSAQHKLKLEKALIDNTADEGNDNLDVASLLKEALGIH